MSCKNAVLDEDGERVCDCGDEGRLCGACAYAEQLYWRALWDSAPLSERDPQDYRRQMIDAGRGHLLPPED